ncbi:hypothetical protein ES677_03315 [Bizionia gelidisalsuginis]|uniref:Uncharacterized protein n=1 Tax=Bizionia gelidisalsuginis TaxID=291188 RepID=A0ABY3MD20_9FLAO|nr:hypothetical protein [Bizionia gelidisalsuginis]TYC16214.1 hypothetical protein ES677_03315 [Bizionia gelidisalsuginis]
MQHHFYSKSKREQNQIQLKIGSFALLINSLALSVSFFSGFYLVFFLLLAITLSIVAPFFDVPSLKQKGSLVYYSSLLVAEREKKGVVKIHGGSLFDYVFVIDRALNGTQRTNFILQQYLEGLLNLINDFEAKKNTAVKIQGTSYILNERTANRIGLKVIKTDFLQKFILVFNYLPLLISSSFAKGKLSFPNLRKSKSFEGELIELMERKQNIQNLSNKLKRSITGL